MNLEMPFSVKRERHFLGSYFLLLFKGEEFGKTRMSEQDADEMVVGLNAAYWNGFQDGQKNPDEKVKITFRDRY